jgi:DNA-binding CsgD family transcriptional regulator
MGLMFKTNQTTKEPLPKYHPRQTSLAVQSIRAKLQEWHRQGRSDTALSPREREVIRLISLGKSSKEIARIIDICPRTVDTYRERSMEKLDLHSVADVVRYAVRAGMVASTLQQGSSASPLPYSGLIGAAPSSGGGGSYPGPSTFETVMQYLGYVVTSACALELGYKIGKWAYTKLKSTPPEGNVEEPDVGPEIDPVDPPPINTTTELIWANGGQANRRLTILLLKISCYTGPAYFVGTYFGPVGKF